MEIADLDPLNGKLAFFSIRTLVKHFLSWRVAIETAAQRGRTAKDWDVSTGPLAHLFARSLAPLTHSLAPDCSLHSRPLLRLLVRSLAHFAHSLARGEVID